MRTRNLIGLFTIGLFFLLSATTAFAAGNDDWNYTASDVGQYGNYGGYQHTPGFWDYFPFIIGGALVLTLISIPIVLIVQGKRRKDRLRRLTGLIVLNGVLASLVLLGFGAVMPVIGIFGFVILLATVAGGIITMIRSKAWLAFVPLGLLVLVVLVVPLILLRSGGNMMASTSSNRGMMDSAMSPNAAESMGFSVGGAKDVGNFRENIEQGYTPNPTDLTYEGLFYDYYFETGQQRACTELFCPSYDYAITKDPFSGEDIEYLSVGLNSNLKEEDFHRKKLNLIIVMDISGSMGSPFNQYYYDQFNPGGQQKADEEWDDRSKMEIANEAVVDLMGHLEPGDRFGMVLFESVAFLGKPLSEVNETDMEAIKGHILEVHERGGTNMEAGYKLGTELFEEYLGADSDEYENRIIFLTDAMPNTGRTDKESLLGMTKKNSEDKVYTTFIGVGVDFNTELIESITKIRGANYYSVHSAEEFSTRMDDEFELMVTPLVFNLLLELDADGYDIEQVYGSPEANEATGEIMKVNTLFPSRTKDGETRGGIIILKLRRTGGEASLRLRASYEDRSGKTYDNERIVLLSDKRPEYFDNSGIRKAVLLTRYADVAKNWMIETHEHYEQPQAIVMVFSEEEGIPVPVPIELGEWEHRSVPLIVTKEYAEAFKEFAAYFEAEMNAIGDETLQQELDILVKLSQATT